MKLNDYQIEACRTAGGTKDEQQKACALGLAGEAGEVADYLKKVWYHGHDYDHETLKKEIGDVLWYVAVLAGCHGMTLDEVAAANVAKLKARYPEGFDSERSRKRSEDA